MTEIIPGDQGRVKHEVDFNQRQTCHAGEFDRKHKQRNRQKSQDGYS